MIISDREKFVFIHNPKVGGMTFRTALMRHDTRDNFFFEWRWLPGGKKQVDMAHITLFQLQQFYPQVLAEIAPYFKFGFVRNPYTRFLSAVGQHLKLGTPHTRTAILRDPGLFYRVADSFAQTVLDEALIEGDFKLVHFRRQSNFLYLAGKQWVDLVLKLENPDAIIGTPVEAWLGSSAPTAHNRTAAFVEDGYDLGALAPETLAAVSAFYALDFDRFGYDRL